MQDLTIDLEEGRLNCRAGGLIIHQNKVLFHKNTQDTYYALIGGRVQICEDSATTIKREIKEELGKEIKLEGYVATIENFFEAKGKKYHEILFVHRVEFIDENDRNLTDTLKNIEGGKDSTVQYEWIDLDDIDNYDIRPNIIKEILKEAKFPVHKINIRK